MAEGTLSETIIASNVSFDDYLAYFAGDFCELENGNVIKMSPSSLRHEELVFFLRTLLSFYFEAKPTGRVIAAPFVMRLADDRYGREPDLLIVLNDNPGTLHKSYMDGAADICIEIVSPESVTRDHGEKFQEYEKGGVGEYWIIDPLHEECRFFRLTDDGHYLRYAEDASGHYITPRLPQFRLHIPTLLADPLPGPSAIAASIREMLA